MIVKSVLENMGLNYNYVQLGEAEIREDATEDELCESFKYLNYITHSHSSITLLLNSQVFGEYLKLNDNEKR
jgi:hypothetical protein